MTTLELRQAKFIPPKGRGVLVLVDGAMSKPLADAISAFRESNPRENVFFLDQKVAGAVPVDGGNVAYPIAFPKYLRRFFRRLRLQMMLVDSGVSPPISFVRSGLSLSVSVGFMDDLDALPRRLKRLSVGRRSRTPEQVYLGLAAGNARSIAESVSREVVREPEELTNFKKKMRLFIWTNITSRLRASSFRDCPSFDDIRKTLNNPSSVLCLGNGPSSEDRELENGDFDSVFRVNHRWLERSLLAAPDAVFTGALDSVQKVGRDILYVFINRDRATRIAMKASKEVSKFSYANADEMAFPLDFFEPYQPTNGVIMLYFAVMLQPERLTVAGIDLYRDPRGCYPGDSTMHNDYTSAHSEQREVDMIIRLLHSYRGELTIVGESLKTEYEKGKREQKYNAS